MEHCYYVYILASKSRVLYIGVPNDLTARILQHRSGKIVGFTADWGKPVKPIKRKPANATDSRSLHAG